MRYSSTALPLSLQNAHNATTRYAELTATETRVSLRGMPEALDAAIFVQNRWPFVVDPEGKAARFLQCVRACVRGAGLFRCD